MSSDKPQEDKELWKPINLPIIGEIYDVSTHGRVRSKNRHVEFSINGIPRRALFKGKILKENISKRNDYVYVHIRISLHNINRRISVHRLMALTFIPNVHNLQEVNHIDGNKKNNSVANLEWVSKSENALHAFRIGLHIPSSRKKGTRSNLKIRTEDFSLIRELVQKGHTRKEIAKLFGVHLRTIFRVLNEMDIIDNE